MRKRTIKVLLLALVLSVASLPANAATKTDTDAAKDVRQTLTVTYQTQSCAGATWYKITKASVKWEKLAIGARITNGKLNAGAVGAVDCGNGTTTTQVMNKSWANPLFTTYSYGMSWKYTNCLGFCTLWPSLGGAVAANASVTAENRLGSKQKLCGTAVFAGSTNCS